MTGYAIALENFRKLRGDYNGGFRASIPTLARAQVRLTATQAEPIRKLVPHRTLSRAEQNIWDWASEGK